MFTLELPEHMVMVLIEALSNHRYKDAAPVIAELQRQISKQHMARSNGGAERIDAPAP